MKATIRSDLDKDIRVTINNVSFYLNDDVATGVVWPGSVCVIKTNSSHFFFAQLNAMN